MTMCRHLQLPLFHGVALRPSPHISLQLPISIRSPVLVLRAGEMQVLFLAFVLSLAEDLA